MLGVGVVMIPLFVYLHRYSLKIGKQTDEAWETAAEELGGSFRGEQRELFSSQPRHIWADVRGVAVEVDHYTVRTNNSSTTYTRAKARAKAPTDFKLKVSQSGMFSDLARAVGFQDVPVGDPEFDETFVIKSSDPEAAKMWLNAAVRKRIWAASEFSFTLKNNRIEAIHAGLVREPEDLIALIRAVAAFANGRQRITNSWKKLADKYDGEIKPIARRWATLELSFNDVPITIDTKKIGDHHYTTLTARVVGARVEPFVLATDPHLYQSTLPKADLPETPVGIAYELWSAEPATAVKHLSAAICEQINAVSPAKIRADREEIIITLDDIVVKRSALEEAMTLAVALAIGQTEGPYR